MDNVSNSSNEDPMLDLNEDWNWDEEEQERIIETEIKIKHKCTICSHLNKDFFEWTEHIRARHINASTNRRCACGEVCSHFYELMLHYHKEHHRKVIICPCGKHFEDEMEGEEHTQTCTIRGPKCMNCELVVCECDPDEYALPQWMEEEETLSDILIISHILDRMRENR